MISAHGLYWSDPSFAAFVLTEVFSKPKAEGGESSRAFLVFSFFRRNLRLTVPLDFVSLRSNEGTVFNVGWNYLALFPISIETSARLCSRPSLHPCLRSITTLYAFRSSPSLPFFRSFPILDLDWSPPLVCRKRATDLGLISTIARARVLLESLPSLSLLQPSARIQEAFESVSSQDLYQLSSPIASSSGQ